MCLCGDLNVTMSHEISLFILEVNPILRDLEKTQASFVDVRFKG